MCVNYNLVYYKYDGVHHQKEEEQSLEHHCIISHIPNTLTMLSKGGRTSDLPSIGRENPPVNKNLSLLVCDGFIFLIYYGANFI